MNHRETIGFGGIILLLCVFFLIMGVVRYNLAAVTAAIAETPTTIIIDAGHGGEDGGTTGVSGSSESMLNLEISLRLEQLLAFCGFPTCMIRTSDISVYTGDCQTLSEKKVSDLKNRVDLINRFGSAVVVSIHQNHFPKEQYTGAQVFYAPTDTSKELAVLTQNALRAALDPNNHRSCKGAKSVYLMEHIQCPGILVECGFLSNGREEALLINGEYQKKLICALGSALSQYMAKGGLNFEV